MNHTEWKNKQEKTYSFLNKFNLIEYIREFSGKPVYDLMEYLNDVLKCEEGFPTPLFNVISIAEFAQYLNDKYNVSVYEELILE